MTWFRIFKIKQFLKFTFLFLGTKLQNFWPKNPKLCHIRILDFSNMMYFFYRHYKKLPIFHKFWTYLWRRTRRQWVERRGIDGRFCRREKFVPDISSSEEKRIDERIAGCRSGLSQQLLGSEKITFIY